MSIQADRFWSHVEKSDGCWIWRARSDRRGYGRYSAGLLAHRVAYTLTKGPIPEGLELDHLCMTPLCVNPSHLEPVTGAENIRRRVEATKACSNGHEYTAQNTYRASQDEGTHVRSYRRCRTCNRDAARRLAVKKRMQRAVTS